MTVAARRAAREVIRAWRKAYVATWTATLSAALVVAPAAPVRHAVTEVLRLRLRADQTPPPSSSRIAALAAHNFPIAAWPLLLGLVGAHRDVTARRTADVVLAVGIAVNVLQVAAALGAYGPALLAYVPQLPLEWAALALGASGWLCQRQHQLTIRKGLALLALTAGVVLCAATVETVAVPHRGDAASQRNSWGGQRHRPIDTRDRTLGRRA